MSRRYISNDIPLQPLGVAPFELLQATLNQLVHDVPPPTGQLHTHKRSGGLFTGYTGLSYLFLHVSAAHPDLRIAGRKALDWAKLYLGEDGTKAKLERGCCGISSERLSYDAVKACISKDPDDVGNFIADVNLILDADDSDDPFPSELANGKAGTLYLLRMVKHWVPGYERETDQAMKLVAERILATDDDGQGNWEWHGKRYFGAVHGDIGIITQLVLSVPDNAPRLSKKLDELLSYQQSDGNFPSSARSLQKGSSDLIQVCHGATGFLYSLEALRPHFSKLRNKIDSAISGAQEVVWSEGLLIKQPCLCHGIFGNALWVPLSRLSPWCIFF